MDNEDYHEDNVVYFKKVNNLYYSVIMSVYDEKLLQELKDEIPIMKHLLYDPEDNKYIVIVDRIKIVLKILKDFGYKLEKLGSDDDNEN